MHIFYWSEWFYFMAYKFLVDSPHQGRPKNKALSFCQPELGQVGGSWDWMCSKNCNACREAGRTWPFPSDYLLKSSGKLEVPFSDHVFYGSHITMCSLKQHWAHYSEKCTIRKELGTKGYSLQNVKQKSKQHIKADLHVLWTEPLSTYSRGGNAVWKMFASTEYTGVVSAGLSVCPPRKLICWKLYPKDDGVRRWGLEEVRRWWAWGPMNGMSAHSLALLPGEDTMRSLWPRRGPSPNHAPELGPLASEL